MKCVKKLSNDERCGANAMKNSDYCFLHNPDMEEERKMAIIKGGLAPKAETLNLQPVDVKNTEDVVSLLVEALNKVRGGEMNIKMGRGIGYLCSQLLKAIELSSLEKRIQFIEEILLENKRQLNRNNYEK